MALMQLGYLRLALLDAQGSKLKTLILPPPDKNGFELDWEFKGNTFELDNGDEITRALGYLPVLTVRWAAYDERPGQYSVGLLDGQKPSLEALLDLLSQPTGRLRISPGLSAGGFTVDRAIVKPIGRKGLIYTGLELTFRGRHVQPTRALEVF